MDPVTDSLVPSQQPITDSMMQSLDRLSVQNSSLNDRFEALLRKQTGDGEYRLMMGLAVLGRFVEENKQALGLEQFVHTLRSNHRGCSEPNQMEAALQSIVKYVVRQEEHYSFNENSGPSLLPAIVHALCTDEANTAYVAARNERSVKAEDPPLSPLMPWHSTDHETVVGLSRAHCPQILHGMWSRADNNEYVKFTPPMIHRLKALARYRDIVQGLRCEYGLHPYHQIAIGQAVFSAMRYCEDGFLQKAATVVKASLKSLERMTESGSRFANGSSAAALHRIGLNLDTARLGYWLGISHAADATIDSQLQSLHPNDPLSGKILKWMLRLPSSAFPEGITATIEASFRPVLEKLSAKEDASSVLRDVWLKLAITAEDDLAHLMPEQADIRSLQDKKLLRIAFGFASRSGVEKAIPSLKDVSVEGLKTDLEQLLYEMSQEDRQNQRISAIVEEALPLLDSEFIAKVLSLPYLSPNKRLLLLAELYPGEGQEVEEAIADAQVRVEKREQKIAEKKESDAAEKTQVRTEALGALYINSRPGKQGLKWFIPVQVGTSTDPRKGIFIAHTVENEYLLVERPFGHTTSQLICDRYEWDSEQALQRMVRAAQVLGDTITQYESVSRAISKVESLVVGNLPALINKIYVANPQGLNEGEFDKVIRLSLLDQSKPVSATNIAQETFIHRLSSPASYGAKQSLYYEYQIARLNIFDFYVQAAHLFRPAGGDFEVHAHRQEKYHALLKNVRTIEAVKKNPERYLERATQELKTLMAEELSLLCHTDGVKRYKIKSVMQPREVVLVEDVGVFAPETPITVDKLGLWLALHMPFTVDETSWSIGKDS